MRKITYIHQRPDWPNFSCNHEKLVPILTHVRHRQGRLIGRMEALGFGRQSEAVLATLTQEKPPVAASPIAVESLRKSRRANSFVIIDLS